MSDTWSPATYLQFEHERTRAARDLLAQVPLASATTVVDLGCGPGNSTALLLARFPDADVTGVDSSPAMIERARTAVPNARYAVADASTWLPEPGVDLVFANALFQWIPDHLVLLPRVIASLRPGAVTACQMPDNFSEPTHRLMRQIANEGAWADRLSPAGRSSLPSVSRYYDALRPVTSRLDLWHTTYHHILDGPDAIVEWMLGTGLRPFVDPLAPDERTEFLTRYRGLIARAYPPAPDGKVLLHFPRLFVVAVR